MLYSMTGYGKATAIADGWSLSVEMRSLNSKGLELALKLPAAFRPQELNWRSRISNALERGKVDVSITCEKTDGSLAAAVNMALLEKYLLELKALSMKHAIAEDNLIDAALKLPGVLGASAEEEQEGPVAQAELLIDKALEAMAAFRLQEGAKLEADIILRIDNIISLQNQVIALDPERSKRVRKTLEGNLDTFIQQENIDRNRLEQEMIYYLERLDITEELVRLSAHIGYFKEVVAEPVMAKGRKLAFLSQELGREINTIGSKANDKDMQQVVVQMKDELEKIKEQINNIL
jgi:uncharacterized protein (TIGR00255 family)